MPFVPPHRGSMPRIATLDTMSWRDDAGQLLVAPTVSSVNLTNTSPNVGETITALVSYDGVPTPSLTYQWKRSGVSIGGATASAYTVVLADVGATLTCTAFAENSEGTASLESAATDAVPVPPEAPVNTVLPAFSDTTPTVGDTITESSYTTGTWTGVPAPTYSGVVKVGGVTVSLPYVIVVGDVGKTLTVTVTASNSEGSVQATSAATSAVVDINVAPTNTVAPSFYDPMFYVGETIDATSFSRGSWNGNPAPSFADQLKKDGINVSMPYTVVSGDIGKTFTVTVTATNVAGSNAASTPASSPVEAAPAAPANTVAPSFTDTTPVVGDVITTGSFSRGSWTGVPTPTYADQLRRDGFPVTMPYTVVSGDVGSVFVIAVTATNASGSTTATSAATSAVVPAPAAPVNTVLPAFADTTPSVGDTLTTSSFSTGTWTGYPTPSLSSQLKRNGSNVSMPYAVTVDDVGSTFTVTVTATNASGSASATSAATSAVPSTTTYVQEWRHNFDATTTTGWFGNPADGAFQDNKFTSLVQVAGGVVSSTATPTPVGARMMRCDCPAKTTATTPKAHVSREGWDIQEGHTVRTTFLMYLPSGKASYDNLFLLDFEIDGNDLVDPALANNFFGIRLALNASRAFKIDREYTNAADLTDSRNIPFPLDQLVTVDFTMYCHSTNGSVSINVNGTNYFSVTGTNTLPTAAQINAEFGTSASGTTRYRMAQLGATANGHATIAQTCYFDEWWIGVTTAPSGGGGGGGGSPGMTLLGTFEHNMNESTYAAMFGSWPNKWQSLYTVGGGDANYAVRATAGAPEGTAYIQMWTGASIGDVVSKSTLQRTFGGGIEVVAGDVVKTWMKIRMYETNLSEVFTWDIENTAGQSPGVRFKFNSGRNWRLDRGKVGASSLNDAQGRNAPFPVGSWVDVYIEMGMATTEGDPRGYAIVKQNGAEVYRRENIKTMSSPCQRLQFGLTANSSGIPQLMDIDAVKAEFWRPA